MVVGDLGYAWGVMAPGIKNNDCEDENCQWIARHNTVRAHAKAYHVYKTEFKDKQKGVCGITLNCDWYEPKTDSEQDIKELLTYFTQSYFIPKHCRHFLQTTKIGEQMNSIT